MNLNILCIKHDNTSNRRIHLITHTTQHSFADITFNLAIEKKNAHTKTNKLILNKCRRLSMECVDHLS